MVVFLKLGTLSLIYVSMRTRTKYKYNKRIRIYVQNVIRMIEISCFYHVNILLHANIVAINLSNVLSAFMILKRKLKYSFDLSKL